MQSIYQVILRNLSKFSQYVFLLIIILSSIISVSLYNNSRKKVFLEYENLLQNSYFKQSVEKLLSYTNPKYINIDHTVKKGESLNTILTKYKVSNEEIQNTIKTISKVKEIKVLQPGIKLSLLINKEKNEIVELIYPLNRSKKIVLKKNNSNQFTAEKTIAKLEKKIVFEEGKITSSLYRTAKKLNIDDKIIVNFANIYGFQVDFQRDIYKNDSFQILYEKFVNDSEKIYETGDIIYANLILRGQNNALYYFDDNKTVEHYDISGTSVKKALMKTPINGARLSSSFGMRKHPILGYNKMHQGTDFAAPEGTSVMASGDGIVVKAGWCGGGGNCVKIKHNSTYQTVYAHLLKFGRGIKRGVRVKQAQTIGYVGSTGMSTGPHLHYEVIKNGKKINSQTLKLPSGKILKGKKREEFEIQRIKIDVLKSEVINNTS